jgi:hypothetical protein
MTATSIQSRRVILAATIGAALLTGSARAEARFFVGDQSTRTSYSGWAGTISTTGEVGMIEGGMSGLIGITWYEDSDQPCHLGTHLRTLTQGSEAYIDGDFKHCAGNPGNIKSVGFWDNPRYFVRGIAVCSSRTGKSERVKGIKLYAAKAWLTKPEVEELTTAVMEDHTNCGTWNAAVFCPADQAATSLIIYRADRSITGLGLRCRPIQYR